MPTLASNEISLTFLALFLLLLCSFIGGYWLRYFKEDIQNDG